MVCRCCMEIAQYNYIYYLPYLKLNILKFFKYNKVYFCFKHKRYIRKYLAIIAFGFDIIYKSDNLADYRFSVRKWHLVPIVVR